HPDRHCPAALEHISKRSTEHPPTLASLFSFTIPLQRCLPIAMRGDRPRTVFPPNPQHPRIPRAQLLRIAVRTARRNLRASTPWVERVMRPFDLGVLTHWPAPPSR